MRKKYAQKQQVVNLRLNFFSSPVVPPRATGTGVVVSRETGTPGNVALKLSRSICKIDNSGD